MGPKISLRMLSIMHGAKMWNIKISVPQIILFWGSSEYFCYISGYKSVFFALYMKMATFCNLCWYRLGRPALVRRSL